MPEPITEIKWRPIPLSSSDSICKVYLIQAGGLTLPVDLVILPGPNEQSGSVDPEKSKADPKIFYAPDYVFLIEHVPTKEYYIFDLGMRKDLENLPPTLVKNVLPQYDCDPMSPADILKQHGTPDQQAEKVKAVIFSHLHFDHIGDGGKAGFTNAELWVGPTCCTYARPGYPVDPNGVVLTDNLPTDGSRKIVEAFVPDRLLKEAGDKRLGKVERGKDEGLYEAVELREVQWKGIGAFDRAYNVFGDDSAYLIDAPGHSAGHQMMLIRVKKSSPEDDFVLLAGDCFHHPGLLKEPKRTARPPYYKASMHSEPDQAIDTIARTKEFAKKDNIWVLGAHDSSVGAAVASGAKEMEGLVLLNDWRDKRWKRNLSSSL